MIVQMYPTRVVYFQVYSLVETFFLNIAAPLTFSFFYATFHFKKEKGKRYPNFFSHQK